MNSRVSSQDGARSAFGCMGAISETVFVFAVFECHDTFVLRSFICTTRKLLTWGFCILVLFFCTVVGLLNVPVV